MGARLHRAKNKVRVGKHGFSKRSATVFGLLFGVIGTYVIVNSFAATPSTANIWVDSNGGSCTPSDTATIYNDANACGSAQAAYAKSKAGYLVYFRQGTYNASQDLSGAAQISGTSPVTFQAEPGSAVSLNYIDATDINYVVFSDFNTSGWKIKNAQNVTLTRIKASCSGCSTAAIIYDGAKHIRINDSEIGPVDPGDGLQFYPKDNNTVTSTRHNDDIIIDGLFIHDLTRNLDPSAHDDCIAIEDGINMTFKRLKFYNCGTQGFYTSAGGVAPGSLADNITVENSWFGTAPLGYNAVNIRSEANNIMFRNNTFTDAVYLEGVSNVHFVGNIFAGYTWAGADCSYLPDSGHGTVEFKYNVSNVSCGGDATNKADSTIRTKLVNPDPTTSAGYDAHFKPTSSSAPAVNMTGFTLATGCAPTDYDGDARPSGSTCDAGADEFGATGGGSSGPTTYYVSSTGSDTNDCLGNSTPCKTIDVAYQKASGGDTVLLLSNLSTAQTLNNHSAVLSSDITIKPSAGVTATIPSINWCGADNITMQGDIVMSTLTNYSCADSLAQNITIDGLTFDYKFDTSATDGSVVGLYGNANNWTFKNIDIKHGYNVKGFYLSSWTPASTARYPTNITLENSSVHDWDVQWQQIAGDYVHTECFFANKVQGLTLRGNHFYNCVSTGDGIIGDAGAESLHPSNYVFENNIFEQSWNGPQSAGQTVTAHGVSVDGFGYRMSGHNVFRYNLFETGMLSGNSTALPAGTTLDFYGNIGVAPPCNQISNSDYNVWTASISCKGVHDTVNANVLAVSNFSNLSARPTSTTLPSPTLPGDWHYKSTSSMTGAGNPNSTCSAAGQLGAGSSPCYPSTDKDGNIRTGTPDAGPYEIASSSASVPTNATVPAISGTLRVGSTLTSSQGSWDNSPTSYSYQWQRCDSSGANCTSITTSTTSSYALKCVDYKKALKVSVKATNTSGNSTATSAATIAIAKPSTPVKGDFNDDCYIDPTDISLFVAKWRANAATYPVYDITGPGGTPDGQIDAWDLNLLVTGYGYGG